MPYSPPVGVSTEVRDGTTVSPSQTGDLVLGVDTLGVAQNITTDSDGHLQVDVLTAPSGLAQDATLTSGNQIVQLKSGVKGSSPAAVLTSTAAGANHQALDVAIVDAAGNQVTSFGGGLPADVTQTATFTTVGDTLTTADLSGYGSIAVFMNASAPMTIAFEGTTNSGTNWFAVNGVMAKPITASSITSVMDSNNASLQFWRVDVTGLQRFRLRVASGSGSCPVSLRIQPYTSSVSLSNYLPDGSRTIGTMAATQSGTWNVGADLIGTATVNGIGQTAMVAMSGHVGCSVVISSGSLVGTFGCEVSYDGGTNFVASWFEDPATRAKATTWVVSGPTHSARAIAVGAGASHVRVRLTAMTSGSSTINLRATWGDAVRLPEGQAGGTAPPAVLQIGGSDGSALRALRTNTVGRLYTSEAATTSSVTSVASSATSVSLLAANASRVGFALYNESTSILYLKLGATASLTSYTVQVPPNSMCPTLPDYTGAIDGIWASANGSARITELT